MGDFCILIGGYLAITNLGASVQLHSATKPGTMNIGTRPSFSHRLWILVHFGKHDHE
jgi:hypothetical protein